MPLSPETQIWVILILSNNKLSIILSEYQKFGDTHFISQSIEYYTLRIPKKFHSNNLTHIFNKTKGKKLCLLVRCSVCCQFALDVQVCLAQHSSYSRNLYIFPHFIRFLQINSSICQVDLSSGPPFHKTQSTLLHNASIS